MNKFLTILFLVFVSSISLSRDHYYYKDKRIDLIPREDKIAVILKSGNFSEQTVRSEYARFFKGGDVLKKVTDKIYLLNFESSKSQIEIQNLLKLLSEQNSLTKKATQVYYGTSRKVTQIPSDKINLRLKNVRDKEKLFSLNILYHCIVEGNSKDERNFILKTNDNSSADILELAGTYFESGLFEYAEPEFIYPEGCLLLSVPNDQFFASTSLGYCWCSASLISSHSLPFMRVRMRRSSPASRTRPTT